MRVYLAGPIFGCTDDEVFAWRAEAKRRLYFAECVDPSERDYRGADVAPAEVVEWDLADVDASDAVVAYCARPSVGTSMEIRYAYGRGKPVVVVATRGAPVSPWLHYHAHQVVTNLTEAAAVLHRLGTVGRA